MPGQLGLGTFAFGRGAVVGLWASCPGLSSVVNFGSPAISQRPFHAMASLQMQFQPAAAGRCAAVVGLAELPGRVARALSSADDGATMATPVAVPPCLPSFWISLGRLVVLEVLPATICCRRFIFGW